MMCFVTSHSHWAKGKGVFFSPPQGFCLRIYVLLVVGRQVKDGEKDRESEKSTPKWMAILKSLLFHSPPMILGMHANTPGVVFKPLGLGLRSWSAMWESSK